MVAERNTTNQNSLFRSRDWFSANQGQVLPAYNCSSLDLKGRSNVQESINENYSGGWCDKIYGLWLIIFVLFKLSRGEKVEQGKEILGLHFALERNDITTKTKDIFNCWCGLP